MRSPRPRDAASLILLRCTGPRREILMGRRASRDAWSDRDVFPGGRVDRSDSRVSPATPLRPEVERRLCVACSPARARALAVAAIRETIEETGLILGRPAPEPSAVPLPQNTTAVLRELRPRLDSGREPARIPIFKSVHGEHLCLDE